MTREQKMKRQGGQPARVQSKNGKEEPRGKRGDDIGPWEAEGVDRFEVANEATLRVGKRVFDTTQRALGGGL